MDYMELSINDFTDSLLDWGSDIFDDILERCAAAEIDNALDAHTVYTIYNEAINKVYCESEYYGFYRSVKPNRIDIVKYLSALTKNFETLFCAAVLNDMKHRYYVYVQKIWYLSFYMINHKIKHPLIDNTLNSIHADLKSGEKIGYAQILNFWDILDNSLFDYAVSLLEAHIDKVPTPENREPHPDQAFVLPTELDTPQAREYLNRAEKAGFLDKTWKPVKGEMTKIQMKLFAAYCSVLCNITKKHWKTFEDLWGVKSLQKVKEEQGSKAKAKEIADLFSAEIVDEAKKRFNLLI